MQRLAESIKEVEGCSKGLGILRISVDKWAKCGVVHMESESFFEEFENYEVTERDDTQYPYEFSAMVDGIKFFCIGRECDA